MEKSRFNSFLPPKPLGLASVLGAATLAAGLVIGSSEFSPASAASFTFTGSDEGGTGSAIMDFSGIGTNILTVDLDNTSPTTLDSGSGTNTPGITGFGFNSANTPSPSVLSWTLTAFTKDSSGNISLSPTTIASNANTSIWNLEAFDDGVTLHYLPNTEKGIKGALYNPAATSGFGADPNYFTKATLTLNFASGTNFQLASDSPYVRFQNVGLKGEGSLKLDGTPTQPIPEPASMLGIMAFGALGGGRLLRKKKRQAAQG